MLVAGDDRGNVTNYRDLSGNVWWRFKSGARVGTITETAEGILIGSFDNFLYMVSKYTGDVKWKRRLDGRITSSPSILDDRIAAASSTEENFQVIEADTGKPIDRIEFGENRFLLTRPFTGNGGVTVFSLTDTIAAYVPNGCPSK
jgi:outer membrane protein assembly factor BamB